MFGLQLRRNKTTEVPVQNKFNEVTGPFPRSMTKSEWHQLHHGCLFCGSHDVYAGAQGGLNTNFECDNCQAKYNMASVAEEFGCEIIRGPHD